MILSTVIKIKDQNGYFVILLTCIYIYNFFLYFQCLFVLFNHNKTLRFVFVIFPFCFQKVISNFLVLMNFELQYYKNFLSFRDLFCLSLKDLSDLLIIPKFLSISGTQLWLANSKL